MSCCRPMNSSAGRVEPSLHICGLVRPTPAEEPEAVDLSRIFVG